MSERKYTMNRIKMLVVDVDGTMTDGGIYYDNFGNEMKKFCTRDAAGFFAARQTGIQIMVLTGRECPATTKRITELGVDYIVQGVTNKVEYLEDFMQEHKLTKKDVGYIGDDLNDYWAMQLCAYIGCPADACTEIKDIASYISTLNGGSGAVRDAIEFLLRDYGIWDIAVREVYNAGI